MKKVILLISFLVVSFSLIMEVKAADCSYSEQNRLNGLGANVKTDYAIKTRKVTENASTDENPSVNVDFEYYYFTVNIYNITDELYVVVNNKTAGVSNTYYYNVAVDGVISFDSLEYQSTIEYEILIYSTNTDSCNEMLLSTKTVRLPRANRYSDYAVCDKAEGFYLCQDFLTSDYDISEFEFFDRVNKYLDTINKDTDGDEDVDESPSFWMKAIDFIGEYWYYFASGVIVVGLGVGITIAMRLRRRDI